MFSPERFSEMMKQRQMNGMGFNGFPNLTMPQQAQGTPQGRPFNGGMPQRPAMPQQAPQMPMQAMGGQAPQMPQQAMGGQAPQMPMQAFGGQAPQGILSGGLPQFPQAPQMRMDPARLQQILALLAQRR